jgi:hypothetical protein
VPGVERLAQLGGGEFQRFLRERGLRKAVITLNLGIGLPARTLNKLTDRKIRSLCEAGRAIAVSDGGGLTLTVSATGYASWVLRYCSGGRAREISIGSLNKYTGV